MEAVREITVWNGEAQPNHVYLLDGSKIVAYIKWGKGEPEYLRTPLPIDKRGRKFVAVTPSPFKKQVSDNRIPVQGSQGKTYYVDPDEKTCTCPGFTFRGTCKHLSIVK